MESVEERVVVDGGDAGDQVVVAREHLGGAVERDVAPELEWAEPQRRRERRVADDGCRCATAASKSGIVSIGLEGASTRIRSRLARRCCRLVELDRLDAPVAEVVEELLVAVVGALREGDRATRREHRQDDTRDGPHPGGKEQRAPALECPECPLRPRRRSGARRGRRSTGPARRPRRRARWPTGRVALARLDSIGRLFWSHAAKRRGSRLGTGGKALGSGGCPSTTRPRRSSHGWRSCATRSRTPGARRRSSASESAASCSRGSGSSACSIPARSSSSTGSSATARWSSGCARRARRETRS